MPKANNRLPERLLKRQLLSTGVIAGAFFFFFNMDYTRITLDVKKKVPIP